MAEVDIDELEKVKIHRDRIEGESLLVVIREKELELNASLLETKKKAEKIIADARRKAAKQREKAVEDGYKKGQEIYKTELKRTKAEADKIFSTSKNEVKKVKESGKKNFDKAVDMVMKTILP